MHGSDDRAGARELVRTCLQLTRGAIAPVAVTRLRKATPQDKTGRQVDTLGSSAEPKWVWREAAFDSQDVGWIRTAVVQFR